MSDVPQTDWEMICRWEWFRHPQWLQTFRSDTRGKGGGSCRAFGDVCKLIDAEVVLDSACGLGLKTIVMHEMGLNVVGCDGAEQAVTCARNLSRMENIEATYFQSLWQDLPQTMPHHFDAIFNDALACVPEWDVLSESLTGLCEALTSGGFLMFMGATEGSTPVSGAELLQTEWVEEPHEQIEWFYKDGPLSCSKIQMKQLADDYMDEKLLYVINESGSSRLESTSLRRPAYWTWQHWQELTVNAGFCHLETREFRGYGYDGETIKLNVAWKGKRPPPAIDEQARNAPYLD